MGLSKGTIVGVRRCWLGAASSAVIVLALACAAGAQPTTSSLPVWSTDGKVITVATSGTTAYIGGDFSRVGPASSFAAGPFVALDGSTGQAKGTLEPIDPSATQVFTSVADGSGGWYLGGFNVLKHVRSDGTLDPAFTFGISAPSVTALAVSGSTLYIGGDRQVSGSTQDFVGAYNLTTGQSTGFTSVLDALPRQFLLSGTTLYVAGDFTTVDGGTPRNHLAAFNTTTERPLDDLESECERRSCDAIALDGSRRCTPAGSSRR